MNPNLPAAARPAWDALVKLVVVAGAVDPDLPGGFEPGGPVEAAGGEAHPVAARHPPEQRRPALGAEPAPRGVLGVGTVDPAKPGILGELQVRPRRLTGRPHVPRPPAALGAVTEMNVPQGPVDVKGNCPAKTTPRNHARTLPGATGRASGRARVLSRLLPRGPEAGRGLAARPR